MIALLWFVWTGITCMKSVAMATAAIHNAGQPPLTRHPL